MNLKDYKKIQIDVSIVGDKEIQQLNKKYRGKDQATDVLSFNIDEKTDDGYFLGGVVVNKDQAGKQAKEYDNTPEQEISDLVAHGVLHLLGVHHDKDDH